MAYKSAQLISHLSIKWGLIEGTSYHWQKSFVSCREEQGESEGADFVSSLAESSAVLSSVIKILFYRLSKKSSGCDVMNLAVDDTRCRHIGQKVLPNIWTLLGYISLLHYREQLTAHGLQVFPEVIFSVCSPKPSGLFYSSFSLLKSDSVLQYVCAEKENDLVMQPGVGV